MDLLAGLNVELSDQKFQIGLGNLHAGKSAGAMTIPATASNAGLNAEDKEISTTNISVTEPADKIRKRVRVKSTERILIIEDDEETRLYLEEMLSPSYKIMTARDGDSGIKRALTEIPDLVLSDIVMPGTNGLQILKRIKYNPNTTHVPVILLTSNTEMSDRIEGLESGADAYIVKPFILEELLITIDNILKNRQRIRGKYSGAHQEDKIKSIEVQGNSDKLMERIMKVVNDNLDSPDLRVEMLSEEVGLSRAQLHRRVKEITGISTGEFIRNIRLKKAAELLLENKVNISQVGYMVGFSSQTHFSTAFRKFYGVSPSEYINRESRQQ
jgi:DNA-binding response OmpR family regulator